MHSHTQKIKTGGLKLTPRRQAIIELFAAAGSHLTAEEVWARLKKRFDRCGLPGVYRNLESLAECGVLARIQQFDRKKHYGLCSADCAGHHHHITCVNCGRVDEIKHCAMAGTEKIKGYKVISHFMQVNGICAYCADKIGKSSVKRKCL